MPLERLKPRLLEKVWGSAHTEPWFRNTGAKTGEVWLESETSLPLLVKFIFTSEKLSVQVHPDDEYAARHHQGSLGKTEMWHVLAAEPGAQIAAGLREPVSPDRLRQAALSGEIEDLLEWHPASAGDTFFIPAGTIHTIGPGLVLCEVQQNSDITYRLYDYGRGRDLHLDHALAVARSERCAPRQIAEAEPLVTCEYFTVARNRILPQTRGFQLVIATAGSGVIGDEALTAGEVVSLPPDRDNLAVQGDLSFLSVS
jgi:mannose-6-phosphate isomerase